MKSLRTVALGLMVAAAPLIVSADEFPEKPIEVVIHSSYGGGTDTTARMMMIRSRRNLETDMYVVSKRGGSGAKAQNYVLSKPADGYTVMALTQTHLYTMAQDKSDMKIDDIVGIARAMDDPTFIAVGADSTYKSLEDLVSVGKEQGLNWGVANIGGTEHIGLAQFSDEAGMKYKPIAFGSGLQMLQALLSGEIDATLPNVSEAGQMIEDGKVRPLAVMAKERLEEYPDVPTTHELGYPVSTSTTRGYAVRASTPPEVIEKLSAALVKAMEHKTFANYLASAGLKPETSVAGHDVWEKQLKAEYHKAAEALKKLQN
ncbi:MAG: tripartite tricarboxylate transporter substrate binding protein [Rhodobacteraceae bacterium]|nr:tripartite tricarboxylate transporter substrate binding protein [Paracoccaceae bacterium]